MVAQARADDRAKASAKKHAKNNRQSTLKAKERRARAKQGREERLEKSRKRKLPRVWVEPTEFPDNGNFPVHEFTENSRDGTIESKKYYFDSIRWDDLRD